METIILGDKRIGIKTSVLEEKATACNMLCCYADELKEGTLGLIRLVLVYIYFSFVALMVDAKLKLSWLIVIGSGYPNISSPFEILFP